jgi:hypothetical protein
MSTITILVLVLFVVLTRIVKIAKNKGNTDIVTEVIEVGDHLFKSVVLYGVIMFIISLI